MLVLADSPCSGSLNSACIVAQAKSAWLTNQDDPYEEQKRDLLAFASTAAKAATAFELPADELAEGLGKIAQLYKVPTRNIEQLGDALNYLDDNAMSKGGDIINVLQRMGGVADRLDFRKAAALGSTFLSLGAAPEIAASASNAMVRELSIATMQSKRFFEGMNLLQLNPAEIEKQMTTDAMGTIQRVLEKVNNLPQDKRLSAMTMIFGKEFGDDAAKLANNLPELQRQLKLTSGSGANGSMQKESDINKDSLSAQWLLVKTGAQNAFSSLGETLRQPLMDIMGMVKRVTGALRRWVEQNPVLAGTLMKVAAATAAITVGLGALAVAVAAVLGPLAVIRFGLSMLSVKALPSAAAAATRTGNVLRLLISGPLALLRVALFAVGSLLGALLSPVGLVVAALAGVALVIWKYWQPISAFLGGVVEGFKAAAAPISAAFEPLRPVFQWIGDRVTVIGSPLLIVVPIPVLLPAGCIRVNPGKKRQPVLSVVERKPPHPKSRKQNREIIWWERMKTCWFLIVPTPTGAMQSAQQKCSGNACSAGLLHFPCSSLRGGLISIRKCR